MHLRATLLVVNVNKNIETVFFFRDSYGSEQAMNLFWVHEQYLLKAKEQEAAGNEEANLNYDENEFGDLAAEMDNDEVEDEVASDDDKVEDEGASDNEEEARMDEAEGNGDNADD